jgi:hypothetical protein
MIRKKRHDDVVSAVKQQPTKFAKLRRTIGESVEKDKDPFGGPAMFEKLSGAIPPNIRRRSGSQRFDRLHRFVVAEKLLGTIVGKCPPTHRKK